MSCIQSKSTAITENKMEPITLISAAIALATPYLIKTGEKIAEEIGEDIWSVIKRPFTKEKDSEFRIDINNQEEKEKLVNLLEEQLNKDDEFTRELEFAVKKGQNELNAFYKQNITNNEKIEKQINIQNNSGNIQL